MKHSFQKLDPWYVTGLCDGEASFTYSRGSQSINLYFAIKVSNQDRKLLKDLQNFFSGGKIYNINSALKEKKNKPVSYYRISKLSELEKIITHFDKYPLQSQKEKSYQIWREIIFLKKKNFRKPNSEELEGLVQKLSRANLEN
ncbi:MAG TPA: LAGLIDADG family homing endonuclease [Candidatus Pacearchaeota archaeon]|nr:LAGLIDADG family homing endonuclease [Candidatus Pacearchaeota archaeon]HOK93967.1 LAGLIDADG family homing endonuclease [Candidatus Pacearchaeota archaeon]HPO75038.1 LAGLIDADG family homing endonuclease [Candidatus Pacearchaeota archaeon]